MTNTTSLQDRVFCGLVAVFVCSIAAAQTDQSSTSRAAQARTPSQLLAGVQAYPDRVLEALLALAPHPDVVKQAAEQIAKTEPGQPPKIELPDLKADVRLALDALLAAPDVVLIAADNADALAELSRLYGEAPQAARSRLEQLRQGYAHEQRQAARAWQELLQRDPVALGEYRELLTRLCESRRKEHPDFACVEVTQRDYYLACTPSDELAAYVREQGGSPAALRLIERWLEQYGRETVDQRVLQRYSSAPLLSSDERYVAERPAEQRAAMWRPPGAGDGETLGLVPVIHQPPADQPEDARLAYAIGQHARLWLGGGPPPSDSVAGTEEQAGSEVEQVAATQEAPPAESTQPAEPPRQVEVIYEESPYVEAYPLGSVVERTYVYPEYVYDVGYPAYGYSFLARFYYGYSPLICAPYYPVYHRSVRFYGYGYHPHRYYYRTPCDRYGGFFGRYGSLALHSGPRVGHVSGHAVRVERIAGGGSRPGVLSYSPSSGVGVRRHYQSAQEQLAVGFRNSPTQGGRESGSPRISTNSAQYAGRPAGASAGVRGTRSSSDASPRTVPGWMPQRTADERPKSPGHVTPRRSPDAESRRSSPGVGTQRSSPGAAGVRSSSGSSGGRGDSGSARATVPGWSRPAPSGGGRVTTPSRSSRTPSARPASARPASVPSWTASSSSSRGSRSPAVSPSPGWSRGSRSPTISPSRSPTRSSASSFAPQRSFGRSAAPAFSRPSRSPGGGAFGAPRSKAGRRS